MDDHLLLMDYVALAAGFLGAFLLGYAIGQLKSTELDGDGGTL